ncbi:UTP--glucose-1-phosphate uridylyltransferase GalU [Limibacillus halophilus]|uniref:UTP--glucose-1-phosphate uridylyltransferase n=1 Tax=Limibacillus halophilus TaxID=1579333 RepID=A0A839SNQ3_9PROT|nr:UTP--glucose-1-phosphate uridylyltransferase GalU [Limibacillus halophilus]MBB3064431.1 UTP--glucose-1-phosphate uridylyltransferase [Limibacillus halophilus]
MQHKVRKAIFPVGGLGTRFLPATKAMPKEMLPIVDKPLIQYAVEEARAAGIEEFIFVTGRGKAAIEDHFDFSYELEKTLAERGKQEVLAAVSEIPLDPGQIAYVRQQVPKGLGHAVWCARNLVGDEPFAVLLADDLVKAATPCLAQMMDVWEGLGGNLVAAMEIPAADTSRYGILDVAWDDGKIISAKGLVEKPSPEQAPSRLSIIGRYILDPSVMVELGRQDLGAGGEIQLTDAMARTLDRIPFHGLRFEGRRFDCGSKVGFVEATVAFAMEHPETAEAMPDLLSALLHRSR